MIISIHEGIDGCSCCKRVIVDVKDIRPNRDLPVLSV